MSMSVGHGFAHGFAGDENGYSVFGEGKKAKGCVDAKLAGMPVV